MKNHNLSKFVLRAATALAVLTLSAALFLSSFPSAWADGNDVADSDLEPVFDTSRSYAPNSGPSFSYTRTTRKVSPCPECDQYDPKVEREHLKEGIKAVRKSIDEQEGVLSYWELTRRYGDREENEQNIESKKELIKTLKNELADWKNKLANWGEKGKKWKEANEKFRDCVKKCMKKTIIGGGTAGGKKVVTGGGPEGITIDGGKNGKKKKKEEKPVTGGDGATASGKLPDYHTITITVSREEDREMGKEYGKIALPGGEGEVALPGGAQDITVSGGKGGGTAGGKTEGGIEIFSGDSQGLTGHLTAGETKTEKKAAAKALKEALREGGGGTASGNIAITVLPGRKIQKAIDKADDGSTIVVSPGTYLENLKIRGKSITLRSANPADKKTREKTIIKGAGKGSVITASHADKLTISGLTIKGGQAKQGGGIHVDHSSATITDNIITGNKASANGGGIYQTDSIDVAVSNNHILSNRAARDGGGYKNTSKTRPLLTGHDWAYVFKNVFQHNLAGWNGGGAMIEVSGFKLVDNIFSDNLAGFTSPSDTITIDFFKGCGGGTALASSSSSVAAGATWILNSSSGSAKKGSWTVNIAGNRFVGNKARTSGGALCIGNGIKPPLDKLDLTGNTFSNNTPDNVATADLKNKEKKPVTSGDRATASGKLPDYHTITITVSREEDREMGKEFGKIALPGGEGEVALPGGAQDITVSGDTAVSGKTTAKDKDVIKDLSGGEKLTDKVFHCPQPPADHPINVGSKMKVGTGIGKLAGGIAKGLVGGFLGGGGGRGGGDDFMDSEEGPDTSRDPIKKRAKTKFTDPDTGTRIRVGAKSTKDGILFSTHIDKAPGKGTFQTVFLEDNDGRRMLPVRYYVYKIWVKITLTVSWTRSTYVDGQLVKRETGGWSESWTKDLGTFVHRELGEMPVESQPIWRQMGYGRATQGVRGLGTEFPITVEQLKETGPVSFVVHVTSPKQNPVTTVPFIIQTGVNADGDIELTQIKQTPATARCQ